MTYDPTQPRMFADFAAVPTRTERRGARRYWQTAQTSITFDAGPEEHERTPCAACASAEHETDACPHAVAVPMFTDPTPQQETQPMHTSTSAQRDENRLTPADLATMAAAVTTFARQTPNMGTGERYTTAERIAHRAIGCDERDLRDSELLAIRQMFKPILAASHPRQVAR